MVNVLMLIYGLNERNRFFFGKLKNKMVFLKLSCYIK
jgi:hypothetical protein